MSCYTISSVNENIGFLLSNESGVQSAAHEQSELRYCDLVQSISGKQDSYIFFVRSRVEVEQLIKVLLIT